MAQRAKDLGMVLTNRGLYRHTHEQGEILGSHAVDMVPCATEEDIFNALDVPWRPPEMRDGDFQMVGAAATPAPL